MKYLIIEDEKIASKRLKKMILSAFPESEILKIIPSVAESIKFLKTDPQIDIIFMDIQLSDGLSFNIFPQVKIDPPIIFTTSFNEYETMASSKNTIDFLLKPLKINELVKAIKKAKNFHSRFLSFKSKDDIKLIIKYGPKYYITPVDEIAFICFKEAFSILVRKDGYQLPIHLSIDQVKDRLNTPKIIKLTETLLVHSDIINNEAMLQTTNTSMLNKKEIMVLNKLLVENSYDIPTIKN